MASPPQRKTPSTTRPMLKTTRRFRTPVMLIIAGLFVFIGSILIYSSLASTIPVVNTNAEFWRSRIAGCESGSGPNSQPRYTAANGSGNYGAYQFDKRTWASAVGPELASRYPLPSDAPPDVQDQAFYNTFARRGSQPWNASYRCWRTEELAARPIGTLPLKLPRLGSAQPSNPTPPPKNAYNIKIRGRVYIDGKLTANVKLITCVDGVTAQTGSGGVYSFEVPYGQIYCVRVIEGLPAGVRLSKTNNNPERQAEKSYEQQVAGKNYYKNLWQLFTPYYTWDRSYDEDTDFWFVTK